jgi:hypothetical protein
LKRCALILSALLYATPVFAANELTETLTPTDIARLSEFQSARAEAIAIAKREGAPEDVGRLNGILAGEEQPVRGLDIRGDYRCRVTKLAGFSSLVIYDWFRCRIGEDDIGYRLQKLTGSQLVSGHFIDDSETSLIFYGADYYSDEEPKSYNSDPERNTVGRFVKVGERRYRLEFPLPFLESKFDILELEKL